MKTTKQRDYLFDNYKVFLIVLVVIGHFIEQSYEYNSFLYTLKWLIVSFHMPAFIFISVYFSKRELSFKTLFRKLVIPYIVYELIYYLLYIIIIHKSTRLYLMYPKFSLWYILALFIWRLLTPYVKKLPHYMMLSVAAGLLIGCSSIPDNFLSIPRVLVFFPFFLAGTLFDRDILTRLRNRKNQFLALTGIIAFTSFLILEPLHKNLSPKIFYGRYNYNYLGQGSLEGILCRMICYAIGFGMTFAIALLISEKKNQYSYIGTRTMAVYLFHGLIYSYLKGCTNILQNVNTLFESILLILFCILLTIALSSSQLTTFTNTVSNLHLRDFMAHLTDYNIILPEHVYRYSNRRLAH